MYILYSGIKKHDTLFKHKATNFLEGNLISILRGFCLYWLSEVDKKYFWNIFSYTAAWLSFFYIYRWHWRRTFWCIVLIIKLHYSPMRQIWLDVFGTLSRLRFKLTFWNAVFKLMHLALRLPPNAQENFLWHRSMPALVCSDLYSLWWSIPKHRSVLLQLVLNH